MSASRTPLAELLDLLRRQGVAVGVRQERAVTRLLRASAGMTLAELRGGLARILGHTPDEVAAVEALFDQHLGGVAAGPGPVAAPGSAAAPGPVSDGGSTPGQPATGPSPATPGVGPRRGLWLVLLVGLLLGAFVWGARWLVNHTGPSSPADLRPAVDLRPAADLRPAMDLRSPADLSAPGPPPPPPPDGKLPLVTGTGPGPTWPLRVGLGLGLALLLLIGPARRRHLHEQAAQRHYGDELSRCPGPRRYRLHVPLRPPLSRADLDDVATLWCRVCTDAGRGHGLDVPATVREVGRTGRLLRLRERPLLSPQPVLVLTDQNLETATYAWKIEPLLSGLVARGVPLVRFRFESVADRVWSDEDGPRLSLEAVLRARQGWPVLVISEGSGGAGTWGSPAPWVLELGRAARRSWLHPVDDPALWRAEMRDPAVARPRFPFRVWPITRLGLRGVASDLAADAGRRFHVPRDGLRRPALTKEQYRRMEELVALVPYPERALVEWLRQRYFGADEMPTDVLRYLLGNSEAPGAREVRLRPAALEQAQARLRGRAPWLEERVRKDLYDLITASRPAEEGSPAELRWQLDRLMQQVYLPDDALREEALTELSKLRAGPLYEEASEAVERLAEPAGRGEPALPPGQPVSAPVQAGIERLRRPVELPAGVRLGWGAGYGAGMLAAAGAVGLFGLLQAAWPVRVLPPEQGYVLRVEPATAGRAVLVAELFDVGDPRAAGWRELAGQVALYRDGVAQPVRLNPLALVGVAVAVETEAHKYFVMAQRGDGTPVVSQVVSVGGAAAPDGGGDLGDGGAGPADQSAGPADLRDGAAPVDQRLAPGRLLLSLELPGVKPTEVRVGARVWDGQSPTEVPAGPVRVRVSADFYELDFKTTVAAGEQAELALRGAANRGLAALEVPAGAVLMLPAGLREWGRPTPQGGGQRRTLRGAPGEYKVRVRAGELTAPAVGVSLRAGELALVGPVQLVAIKDMSPADLARRPPPPDLALPSTPDLGTSAPMVALASYPGMKTFAGGKFMMGADDLGEKRHEETVAPFAMDLTEVTVDEYAACVKATKCSEPRKPSADDKVNTAACNWGQPGRGRHPINCVDHAQAQAYCEYRNKQLPTEVEWEFAASDGQGRRYPWGDKPEPGPELLNACGQECVEWGQKEFGGSWQRMYPGRDRWPMTAPVGSFPKGATSAGLLDMAGNVWEWTSSPYCSGGYRKNCVSKDTFVVRGGSWCGSVPRVARAAFRNVIHATYQLDVLGFRCSRTVRDLAR